MTYRRVRTEHHDDTYFDDDDDAVGAGVSSSVGAGSLALAAISYASATAPIIKPAMRPYDRNDGGDERVHHGSLSESARRRVRRMVELATVREVT